MYACLGSLNQVENSIFGRPGEHVTTSNQPVYSVTNNQLYLVSTSSPHMIPVIKSLNMLQRSREHYML